MPTQINQIDLPDRRRTILRVEGDMLREDALLLERVVDGIHASSGHSIVIDLADLDFMDSDAASVLKRLVDRDEIEIEGVAIFLQSAIDMAERA
ncbi:MAG TPA: STAS domain-containing protein [Pyrinomonadaceae bacterium]|nr:STAS domain-containing protein [Pyrinomonadaceae bacterium]